jgi:hypothetical protein
VKTPLLVSTDSCFHRPAWIPEVVVKSAKFHTCSQTTASMRSKPDVHAHVFDPVFLAPGFGYDRVQAGIRVGADGVADDVDSARSSGMAGAPTSFVNGRRQYGAYDIDTHRGGQDGKGSAESRRAVSSRSGRRQSG